MAKTVRLEEWLDVLSKEYLSSFVMDGGASIKFAVASDAARPEVIDKVEDLCRSQNYVVIKVDAACVRVHMPQDIFFDIIPSPGLFRVHSGTWGCSCGCVHRTRNNHRLFRKARTLSSGRNRADVAGIGVVLAKAASFNLRSACR